MSVSSFLKIVLAIITITVIIKSAIYIVTLAFVNAPYSGDEICPECPDNVQVWYEKGAGSYVAIINHGESELWEVPHPCCGAMHDEIIRVETLNKTEDVYSRTYLGRINASDTGNSTAVFNITNPNNRLAMIVTDNQSYIIYNVRSCTLGHCN